MNNPAPAPETTFAALGPAAGLDRAMIDAVAAQGWSFAAQPNAVLLFGDAEPPALPVRDDGVARVAVFVVRRKRFGQGLDDAAITAFAHEARTRATPLAPDWRANLLVALERPEAPIPADELAAAALFLFENDAIVGEAIVLDGG